MAKTIYDLLDAQQGRPGYFPYEDDYSSPRQISNSYFLHSLNLKIKDGTWISMSEVFQYMEIFEDIYSSAIHGTIDVLDMSGGFSKFLITGGEEIKLVVCKSVESPDIIIDRDDFIVYQVTDMKVTDQKIMQFKLHFISKSAIEAQKKRLYRTYQNERKISNLVTEIYKDIAGVGDIYIKMDDSKCVVDRDFVCPGYTPLQAIDVLSKRACGSGDYYLFFERLAKLQGKKHVFTSMKNMQNRIDAFDSGDITIAYNVTTEHFNASSSSVYRASTVSFVDNYNHLQNMMAGMYNSGIKIIDVTSRSFSDITINYMQDTNDSQRSLNTSNYFSQYVNFFPEQPGERIIPRSTNDVSSNSGSWLKIDTINSVIISMFRLIVDMPGNNTLGVGNYVTLTLPSNEAINLNIGSGIVPTDPYYTGKYLITAVKHSFTTKEYNKKIEVSRIEMPISINGVVNDSAPIAIAPPPPPPPPAAAPAVPPPPPPPAPPPPPPIPAEPVVVSRVVRNVSGQTSFGARIVEP